MHKIMLVFQSLAQISFRNKYMDGSNSFFESQGNSSDSSGNKVLGDIYGNLLVIS